MDASTIRKIVGACSSWKGALEIGPGPGVLTGPLSETLELVALDADPRMALAAGEFAPRAKVRHQDALQADWREILSMLPEPRGIVSNMPYNITGPLLGRTADCADLIAGAVLMMQAEVAAKITAPPGDSIRGSLTVWLQSLFLIHRLVKVPPGSFLPPPKVESAVLVLVPREPAAMDGESLELVRRGFASPRKTLANNLKGDGADGTLLESLGLQASVRPHQLTEEQWQRLTMRLKRTG